MGLDPLRPQQHAQRYIDLYSHDEPTTQLPPRGPAMTDQPDDSTRLVHLTDREKDYMAAVREKLRRRYADPDITYDLPARLTDLNGPATGTVELPEDLDAHGLGPFDLANTRDTDTLYKLVLAHATTTEHLHHLNHTILIDIWPRLRINNLLRDTWQQHFDALTSNQGVNTLRGPMHGLGRQYALAESRETLDGPTTGEVVLPNRLDHSGGHRTYDLSDPPQVETMYTAVLNEALNQGHLGFLNWDILVDIWPVLRISNRVRDMWEAAYPELTGNPGLWGHRRI